MRKICWRSCNPQTHHFHGLLLPTLLLLPNMSRDVSATAVEGEGGKPCARRSEEDPGPEYVARVLGAFAKLRKATISFFMSVCFPLRTHVTTRPPPEKFS